MLLFYLVFSLSFNLLQEVRRSGSKDPQSITLINFLVPLFYFKDWRTRLVTKLVNLNHQFSPQRNIINRP
jgi:hypothetical protein